MLRTLSPLAMPISQASPRWLGQGGPPISNASCDSDPSASRRPDSPRIGPLPHGVKASSAPQASGGHPASWEDRSTGCSRRSASEILPLTATNKKLYSVKLCKAGLLHISTETGHDSFGRGKPWETSEKISNNVLPQASV